MGINPKSEGINNTRNFPIPMDNWEEKMLLLVKHGHRDRVKFLETLHKSVLPLQLKKIQQNDKTVLKDLVLPSWLDWDLLYEWSLRSELIQSARECILCNKEQEFGMEFNEKFICENCFLKLKNQ